MDKLVFWQSANPTSCDICGVDIILSFVDGKTKMGPWAIMDGKCHASHGVGLGTGKGQKYAWDSATKRFQKIAG